MTDQLMQFKKIAMPYRTENTMMQETASEKAAGILGIKILLRVYVLPH